MAQSEIELVYEKYYWIEFKGDPNHKYTVAKFSPSFGGCFFVTGKNLQFYASEVNIISCVDEPERDIELVSEKYYWVQFAGKIYLGQYWVGDTRKWFKFFEFHNSLYLEEVTVLARIEDYKQEEK
jgi:hypothetical protein